ncbi:hypothetical protein ACHHYP_00882 [Achlya hypogyna]|uniref:Uncharacterized protein n=1 Tax=Achlya hypogyna TaxID=1202772 RepID=A0A1V9ZA73_ACHHY|nr:hypothetical protein ACHHYP_00882 [Achlya hypogyna]
MASKRVVVVCGWMGAGGRPVDKYAQIYRQLGFDAVVLVSSTWDFFKSERQVQAGAAKALLDMVRSSDVEIIPHMLSNGGCRSWYCLEDHLRTALGEVKVPAMIFDSAPSLGTEDAVNFTWWGARHLPSLAECAGVRASLSMLKWLPFCTSATDHFARHWDRFFGAQQVVPKLFFYSSSDTFVDADSVQAAIAAAKEGGATVEAVDFKQSTHVNHLTYDPITYSKTIASFLAKHVS